MSTGKPWDTPGLPVTISNYSSTSRGTEMARVMDKLNAVIMSFKGTSPQEAAKREEERMKEKEQIA